MTIPMVWGLLAVMLFNLVDTFFIGRLGAEPLAAIGFTFPVVFVVTGTAMGMGVGMSSVVSRAIGQGDSEAVHRLTSDGLLLATLTVLTMVAIGLLTMKPVFSALGAGEEMQVLIRQYMLPWYLGIVFLVVPMVGNSAIRATGDTKTPSLIMILAGGLNVVLDPLLIFGIGPFPRLELTGAALATVLAYLITFMAAFWVLKYRERMLDFGWRGWSSLLDSWRRLLYIGLPSVGTNLMVPLAGAIITRIMAGYGSYAVAAYGVGSRLESLAMAGCFAMSTSVAAFSGQNFGAGRCDRIKEAMVFVAKYCFVLCTVTWVALAAFAEPIARLFNETAAIVDIVKLFIWIVPASYAGFGFMLAVAATFNASNHPLHSVILFTMRLFVLTIPLALLGSHLGGVPGVLWAVFVGNILAGLFAAVMIRRQLRIVSEAQVMQPAFLE